MFTLGKFINWLEEGAVVEANEISTRHVRMDLSAMAQRELTDTYIHSHARAVRTFVRFLYSEGYHPEEVKFQMPALSQKRLPVLGADELRQVISVCKQPHDLALVP